MSFDFLDIKIENNTLDCSQIMNLKLLSNVKQNLKMFVLTNNYFKNNSIFIMCQQNSDILTEISLAFEKFYIQNNFLTIQL